MAQKFAYDIVKDYLTFLKKNNVPVVKGFLFGSHAKGTQGSNSDIDLAVVLAEITDRFDAGVQLAKLTINVDTRIEPHLFDVKEFNISHPFAKEILQHGIEII